MILKQAEDYYNNGVITTLKAVKCQDVRWNLQVETNIENYLITTVRGATKLYMTLDALYVDVQRITAFSPDLSVDFSRYFADDIGE